MDILLFMPTPWFWLILTVVFSIIELLSGVALTTIWFALSAFLMTFLSNLVVSFRWQLAIFLVVAVTLFVFTRPIAVKKLRAGREKTNIDSLAGKAALVVKSIGEFEKGEVKLNGLIWSAQSEDGKPIKEGTKCSVVKIEGARAIVRPASGPEEHEKKEEDAGPSS